MVHPLFSSQAGLRVTNLKIDYIWISLRWRPIYTTCSLLLLMLDFSHLFLVWSSGVFLGHFPSLSPFFLYNLLSSLHIWSSESSMCLILYSTHLFSTSSKSSQFHLCVLCLYFGKLKLKIFQMFIPQVDSTVQWQANYQTCSWLVFGSPLVSKHGISVGKLGPSNNNKYKNI